MIGTTLCDRYQVEKRLGKGAFGEVYKAFDVQLKRHVAIKVLVEPGYQDSFRNRFLRECEAMANLKHPNIATVFDFGEVNGRPFLVMEYVDGGTLLGIGDALRQDYPQLLRIASHVCRAMDYAHRNGVVHRDLTLKNILVDGEGNARVVDFGLAKVVHGEVRSDSGTVVGTPNYLAPEQAAGRAVDGRADVFAFGVCFYRLLAGRFPFEAEHPTALLYLMQHEDPAPLSADVPADLQDVVLKCLEKSPADRYASFGEVAAAIEGLRKRSVDSDAPSRSSQAMTASGASERNSRRNPYLSRVMIKDPKDFFGRSREVKRIYSRLDAPRPQSVAVVGERRIGKSSLLNFLYNRRNRRLHMTNHHDTVFIYMDFQRAREIDIPKFIDMLFSMLNYEMGMEISGTTGDRSLDGLSRVVEKVNGQGRRIVMLMDEFETVTTNPAFDMQFFSFLRFLANNYKVAYVTSSYRDLQQMCHDKDIADSPFFNIFSNLPLRPFSHEEALELIQVPSEREGLPLEKQAERILELSGYFPIFIQIACANAFEWLAENGGTEPDWREIERLFVDEARPHYAFIWERLEDAARTNLTRIAVGKSVGHKVEHVSEDLVRRGYLLPQDGKIRLFSKPFREFVMEQGAAGDSVRWFFSSLFARARTKAVQTRSR